MACNHPDAVIDTHTPVAAFVSQGMGNIETNDFDVKNVFPFNNLPVELQNKIIGYAMTATDQEIMFPCLTNASYTPNITAGLLLVNHRMYHEAHYQLRKQNKFVFANFGSDLMAIASSIGPLKCRSGDCGHSPLHSLLEDVEFHLGDEDLPDHGDDKVHAFGCALRHLRSEITISSLHIQLGYHAFSNSAQLSWFASTLDKIKVQDKVTFVGDERYLDMSFGCLPSSLGMNVMPVYARFEPYNPDVQYSPGWFNHQYQREKHIDKDAEPQRQYLVVA